VSVVARLEVPAALCRKHRSGELSLEDASVLVEAFEWEWFGGAGTTGRFAVVPLVDTVLETAAGLTDVHGLRAYDAMQLASALLARSVDPGLAEVVCFDTELAAAARLERFRVTP